MGVHFITAIDTDAGKSVATGAMARYLAGMEASVTTAKLAQTGCEALSEDILTHRMMMGREPGEEDMGGLTCPYLFKLPASPHLAAEREGVAVDPQRITDSIKALGARYRHVLVEGVGGWLVPLTRELLCGDYVRANGWPVILVTSPRLGSINHTLLTLEAIASRKVTLTGLVYNLGVEASPEIVADSRGVISDAAKRLFGEVPVVDLPFFDDIGAAPVVDFSSFFSLSCGGGEANG